MRGPLPRLRARARIVGPGHRRPAFCAGLRRRRAEADATCAAGTAALRIDLRRVPRPGRGAPAVGGGWNAAPASSGGRELVGAWSGDPRFDPQWGGLERRRPFRRWRAGPTVRSRASGTCPGTATPYRKKFAAPSRGRRALATGPGPGPGDGRGPRLNGRALGIVWAPPSPIDLGSRAQGRGKPAGNRHRELLAEPDHRRCQLAARAPSDPDQHRHAQGRQPAHALGPPGPGLLEAPLPGR